MKLARLHGHNKGFSHPEVIVFKNSFHGRSIATLSATANPKVQKGFGPLVEGFTHLPLNDLGAIEQTLREKQQVSAIFLESIQGEGGIRPADVAFLKSLRAIADQHDVLLMLDEVQCELVVPAAGLLINGPMSRPMLCHWQRGLGPVCRLVPLWPMERLHLYSPREAMEQPLVEIRLRCEPVSQRLPSSRTSPCLKMQRLGANRYEQHWSRPLRTRLQLQKFGARGS